MIDQSAKEFVDELIRKGNEWEYKVMKISDLTVNVNEQGLENQMNVLGRQGFECFEIVRGTTANIFLFKRKA